MTRPMQGVARCAKVEASGNTTYCHKAWWYDDNGRRGFTSFAEEKYGPEKAEELAQASMKAKRRIEE